MTLAAQRVLCAVSQKSPEKLVPALDSLYRAFWVDGNSKTAKPEVFIPILERVLGKGETQEIIQAVCRIHAIPIEFVLMKHGSRVNKTSKLSWVPTLTGRSSLVPLVFLGLNAPTPGVKQRDSGALTIWVKWQTSWDWIAVLTRDSARYSRDRARRLVLLEML